MNKRLHLMVWAAAFVGCTFGEEPASLPKPSTQAIKSELLTEEGLPATLAQQPPIWERLHEGTFRRPAEAFRVYPGGATATLSPSTERWTVGPVVPEPQLRGLTAAIEGGSFFDLEHAHGEDKSGGRCAKPHGGCVQWTVNWNGRTHWVRRASTVPDAVHGIQASLQ